MPSAATTRLKKEFKLRNLGFGYEQPHFFHLPEWRQCHGLFVGWRVFWAVWHVVWLAISIQDKVDKDLGGKWFIYLTHWSYVMLTIQSVIHMAVVIYQTCKEKGPPLLPHGEISTKWYHKLLWYFTSVSFVSALIVTILYWGFVFTKLKVAVSVMTHAINTVYVIADIFIAASPTRLLHFVHATGYGLVYAAFTLIYHLAGGTNSKGEPFIYSLVNWDNPGKVIGFTILLNVVAIPVMHCCLYGLYFLRMCMSERLGCGRKSDGDDDETVLCVTG